MNLFFRSKRPVSPYSALLNLLCCDQEDAEHFEVETWRDGLWISTKWSKRSKGWDLIWQFLTISCSGDLQALPNLEESWARSSQFGIQMIIVTNSWALKVQVIKISIRMKCSWCGKRCWKRCWCRKKSRTPVALRPKGCADSLPAIQRSSCVCKLYRASSNQATM